MQSSMYAQPNNNGQKHLQKVDQLEKLKLIETMGLDEQLNIRLITRRQEFKAKNRNFVRAMDSLVTEMEQNIKKGEKQSSVLKREIDEYTRIESQLLKNKQEYISSLYDILTPEQVAKYLVFERNFKKEIQELMFKNKNRNPHGE